MCDVRIVKVCGVVLMAAMVAPANAGQNTALAPAPQLPPPSAILAKPSFAATPSELRSEVTRILALDARYREADVTLIADESRLTFDAQGRVDNKHRMVFIVNTQVGAENWGTVSAGYSPFYQDKPTMRIRVIARDNTVTELDPKLIVDRPDVEESANIFSDSRKLDAPLPRLVPGAIVEEEFSYHDREPMLAAGTTRAFGIGRDMPVYQEIVSLNAPSSLRLKVTPRGFAKAPVPQVRTAGVRSESTYVFAPSFAQPDYQYNAPSDVYQYPMLHVSTAPTWAAVAADYRKLVEPKINAPGLVIPSTIKAATEIATVQNLIAWLHARVRYTGIEFGDAAFIPWTPAETLARGFGDCKDTAALLVAGLRSVGIKADLAVLNTGPGLDIERAAPGMGRFDHAIVRAVVGGKPLWIDGTEDMLPAGILPTRDQGRLAMVVAADTKDLELTPVSGFADTVIHEVRDYAVGLDGAANAVETTTETGVMFDNMRRWALNSKRDEILKNLKEYVQSSYDGDVQNFHADNAADVGSKFTFVIDVNDARRVYVGRSKIDAYLYASAALNELPKALRSSDDELDDEAKRRTLDFVVPMMHRKVVENRIAVPESFELPTLVPRTEIPLGAFSLIATRRLEGRVVVVTYTCETSKLRLTPDEFRQTRKAVRAQFDADSEHIIIQEQSAALIATGKFQAAVQEAQRQIALAPNQSVGYGRLAAAYREAGMGKAAWRAAREGTVKDPTNGDAYTLLAFALLHDEIGRYRGPGFDRAGAIKAYRRALELTPTHLGAHEGLGLTLRIDVEGRLSSSVAELREAVVHLAKAQEIEDNSEHASLIAAAQLAAGDFAASEQSAAKISDVVARAAAQIAAVGMREGEAAALRRLDNANLGNQRNDALDAAAIIALRLRAYPLATALRNAYKGTPPAGYALTPKLRKHEVREFDLKSPVTLGLGCNLETVGVALLPCRLRYRANKGSAEKRLQTARAARSEWLVAMSDAAILDLFVGILNITATGDGATGWRMEIGAAGKKGVMYAVLDGGTVVGIGDTAAPGGVGLHALALLKKGDSDSARRLLTWLAADLVGSKAALAEQFIELWQTQQARAAGAALDKNFLEFAAAIVALLQSDDLKVNLTDIFKRCAAQIDRAAERCEAYRRIAAAQVFDVATLETTERAQLAKSPSEDNKLNVVRVLLLARKFADANKLLDEVLTQSPRSLPALRTRMGVRMSSKATAAERDTAFDAVVTHPDATPDDLNNVAWARLFYDQGQAAALALGQRIEKQMAKLPAHIANTMAAIAAESNDASLAWHYFVLSRKAKAEMAPLEDSDWYVLGRIREAYGLRDDAIAAYRMVPPVTEPHDAPMAYDFAQRGLVRLKAATK